MRFVRNIAIASVMCIGAIVSSASSLMAQLAQEPVAVISITNLGELQKDLKYILASVRVPELGGMLTVMTDTYSSGLDKSRPMVVSVTLDGQAPNFVVALPASDMKAFFSTLEVAGIQSEDLGSGLYEIQAQGQTIYAKDGGSWMFVAQSEDALSAVPQDPLALVGQLPQDYDLCVRVDLAAVPDELKETALGYLNEGFERALAEQSDGSEEELEKARQTGEAQMAQFTELVNSTEQALLGWNVDEASKNTYLDWQMQFIEGSMMATEADAQQKLTSDLTAFMLPNSSMAARFSMIIATEEQKEISKSSLELSIGQAQQMVEKSDYSNEELRDVVIEFLDSWGEIAAKTIDGGTFDYAMSASTSTGQLQFLIGGNTADGKALEEELKKVAEAIPASDNAPKFEFNYGTYKGLNLHRVTAPMKSNDPAAEKVFGDQLTFTIGTSSNFFLISLDPAGDSAFKAAVDAMQAKSKVPVNPLDMTINVTRLLEYALEIAPNPILEAAVQAISQLPDNNKIEVVGNVIPRGAQYRLSIEEGVLRAIGTAVKAGQQANRGGGF